jgi:RHH-type transcriptional regulator, proline utilization regulon repressor / proline dehydrogenase / delta 1-pyrroline-5-carboxylate dehydrogenase
VDFPLNQPPLRYAIAQAYLRAEADCLPPLIAAATLSEGQKTAAQEAARQLVQALRSVKNPADIKTLFYEYPLSGAEGLALMSLAEALLRIPDAPTRDALIHDKIAGGNWRRHLGASRSRFVNAATLGLLLAGIVSGPGSHAVARFCVRKAMERTMRQFGRNFVMAETIGQALARAKKHGATFRYSYDMLGEAAVTAEDAARYFGAYAGAIAAIGAAAPGSRIEENPGISVKLSALHPRYGWQQRDRIMAELLPRLTRLASLARAQNIGLTIDAEEADRLDLSLDLLEALCAASELETWDGIGFAVQAYQKCAPQVLDFCIDLARASHHRLMLRLVKGAYWDNEIKRAQTDGLEDFAVFTRKNHTDISFLACVRKLLDAGAAVYPQFATHNVLTWATIQAMAGDVPASAYEFQALYGMGEALYAAAGPVPPCRIYAPVGSTKTLLAYLVRRLLENGANSSFMHRIANPAIRPDELLQDPVEQFHAQKTPLGAPHEKIQRPPELFGAPRKNSEGLDLSHAFARQTLAEEILRTPAALEDIFPAGPEQIERAFSQAEAATPPPPSTRAKNLTRAAVLLEQNRAALLNLLIREGRRTIPNGLAEIREAVDFLRYYAAQIQDWPTGQHRPLGVVVCISPWNFPLSIFLGQIAGALAAGNAVLAKPAEQTPRIAAFATRLLHEAGFVPEILHLIQGAGETGAALVGDARAAGVVFTGSTEVARSIQRQLSRRTSPAGKPIPLIAETGGINAMIVDSTALAEQVVTDVLASAFDSAGQRCSALRLLCLQQDAAADILPMLERAMRELTLGPPDRLDTDIGPVITPEAKAGILAYIETMRRAGHRITQIPTPIEGNYVPPTLIEIPSVVSLPKEIFGPVLHIVKFPRTGLEKLLDAINATGYGLTFGLHSRINATIGHVTSRIHAGNIYVNRNIIGAVVGVQPFGGEGMSGTGPKAGGPLYVHRLLASGPAILPRDAELPGPAGERNLYRVAPRGTVLCLSKTPQGEAAQRAALAASGNRAVFDVTAHFDAALLEGDADDVLRISEILAARPGPIVAVQALSSAELAAGETYNPAWLVTERVISINTAAAGGNAGLMMLE